jgi:hypothetical protein
MLTRYLPVAWRPFAKAVAAAAVPAVSIVVTGLVTGAWDTVALAGVCTGIVSAAGVYVAEAVPRTKALVSAGVVLAGALITSAFTGHWDSTVIAGGVTAVVSALLVLKVPNEPAS